MKSAVCASKSIFPLDSRNLLPIKHAAFNHVEGRADKGLKHSFVARRQPRPLTRCWQLAPTHETIRRGSNQRAGRCKPRHDLPWACGGPCAGMAWPAQSSPENPGSPRRLASLSGCAHLLSNVGMRNSLDPTSKRPSSPPRAGPLQTTMRMAQHFAAAKARADGGAPACRYCRL